MVCYALPEIFARHKEKDEGLIQLLNNAYIHARYKGDYFAGKSDLVAIIGRVIELKKLMLV